MALAVVAGITGMGALSGCGGGGGGSTPVAASSPTASALTIDNTAATMNVDKGSNTNAGAIEPVSYLADSADSKAEPTRAATYPIITVTRTPTTRTVVVDYGTTPVTTHGGRMISGVVTLTRDITDKTGTIAWSNFTVNGRDITGSATTSNLSVSSTGVSGTLTFNITVSGVGNTAGSIDFVSVRATHELTTTTGSYTVTPAGGATAYTVVPSNIVRDPVTNGNFVPESGTKTITYTITKLGQTVTVTIVVTYTSASPVTGVVEVSVDGAAPVDETLPKFK